MPNAPHNPNQHQDLYLDVAIPTPLRRSFAYRAPAGTDPAQLTAGMRLRVPFGRRSVTGVLLGRTHAPDIEPTRLKSVQTVLDSLPAIQPGILKLCIWAAGYYHHAIGEVLATAMPLLLRQGESLDTSVQTLRATAAASAANLTRAPRQAALFARLLMAPTGLTREELARDQTGAHLIKALVEKELAQWHDQQVPGPDSFNPHDLAVDYNGLQTNEQQRAAIESIHAGGDRTTLLFGITGSGKTEVYLRLIESTLRAGRQALVLVPEIGLTPQTVNRFTSRFNVPVVAMHSGLTDRERLDAWRSARAGSAGIVIGTRSAIFTPMKNLGLIVVDEEHDASFKQQDGFRYNARDLAVVRGQLLSIPVILGSATPSIESWHNAETGKYARAILDKRPGRSSLAQYKVIDIRARPLTEGCSGELLEAVGSHLAAGNQVLVFLNRRGFAPVLLCRQCGHIAECNRCDARLTLHARLGLLICHHCSGQTRVYRQCPDCGGENLVPLGEGTQRIEAALAGLFPDYPVLRLDRDSTRRKQAMSEFMAQVVSGEPSILVGTQLLAKGHHFPDVTLVAIVNMDGGFYSADYKAMERMAQLTLQVGGRAGRAQKPGLVAIQTHFPDQEIFRTLIDDGYGTFADKLLAERKHHGLPPYYFQALLRADAGTRELPFEFLESITGQVTARPSVSILGPVPSAMERRAGRFRAQLLLTGRHRQTLHTAVEDCIHAAEQSSLGRKVRWSVDVDPVDLF